MNLRAGNRSPRPFRSLPGALLRSIIVLLLGAFGCSYDEITSRPTDLVATPFRLIPDHERIIRAPQRDHYHVRWGFLKLGEITFDYRAPTDGAADALIVTCATAPTEWAESLASFGGYAVSRIDQRTMLPVLYTWNNLDKKTPTRRFDEFTPATGEARGAEVAPWGAKAKIFASVRTVDPVSMLVLVRVIDPVAGEPQRFEMIEGTEKRIATLTFTGKENLKIDYRTERPALRFTLRIDPLKDGALVDGDPDSDVAIWISDDPDRRFLRSEGQVRGNGIRVAWVPEDSVPAAASAPDSRPAL